MKNIIQTILLLGFTILYLTPAQAQSAKKNIVKESFAVTGVCGMCEKRIEKAALIKGVISVAWDKDAQQVNVIYKSKKTSLEEIKTAIAAVGHDTEGLAAPDSAYAELPQCCAYREGVEVH
ncbi:MAG: heavy-metal-associated domain-containing protein [Saprospiraceae bacterium]|nr:heavy-metal-associated domain-containing protein [Saprospiraceae bacterium]